MALSWEGTHNLASFPIPTAARGPDYGIGEPYYPIWHPTYLEQGHVEIVPPNYGQLGSHVGSARFGRFGRTAKVYPITWDPGQDPAFDPRLPAWNNLPRGAVYNAKVPTAKQRANYEASMTKITLQSNARYTPPGVASLTETS